MIENAMATHPAVALATAVGAPDAYVGKLPVCFVELLPNIQIDLEDLHHHAQVSIVERLAWPKSIYVFDNITLTTVTKTFKPSLKCEAANKNVEDLVRNELRITEAEVDVLTGGPRGMYVTVAVPEGNHADRKNAENALNEFLFEAKVVTKEML